MNRDAAAARVLDYVYGELSPEEVEAFEEVLATDAALAAEVEELRQVRSAAASLPRVHLPTEARRRILRVAHHHARMASRSFDLAGFIERLVLSPGFSGALVIVVALGVGTHLLMYGGMDREPSLTELEVRSAARAIAADSAPSAVAETREVGRPPEAEPARSGTVSDLPARADAPKPAAPERPETKRERALAGLTDTLDRRGAGSKASVMGRFAEPPAGYGIFGDGGASIGTGSGTGLGGGGGGGLGKGGSLGGGGIGMSGAGRAASDCAGETERPAPTPVATAAAPASPKKPRDADGDLANHEEASEASKDESTGDKAKKKAEAMPTFAPAPAEKPAAPAASKSDDSAAAASGEDLASDARDLLDQARKLRASGADAAALDLYGRAIAAGLSGKDLTAALAEAAALARKLGRTSLAQTYEKRLEQLGNKHAAPAADE